MGFCILGATDATTLAAASVESKSGFSSTEISDKNLQLSDYDVNVSVLHKIMDFSVSSVATSTNSSFVRGKQLSLDCMC